MVQTRYTRCTAYGYVHLSDYGILWESKYHVSGEQNYFLPAMDMAKVGGPVMCKDRVSVSGWSAICEYFRTNLNIPCPLHTTLLFRIFFPSKTWILMTIPWQNCTYGIPLHNRKWQWKTLSINGRVVGKSSTNGGGNTKMGDSL